MLDVGLRRIRTLAAVPIEPRSETGVSLADRTGALGLVRELLL